MDTPWKINGWNLNITCLKRIIIFQTSIFGFHVNFQGCISTTHLLLSKSLASKQHPSDPGLMVQSLNLRHHNPSLYPPNLAPKTRKGKGTPNDGASKNIHDPPIMMEQKSSSAYFQSSIKLQLGGGALFS